VLLIAQTIQILVSKCNISLQEYQSKQILADNNINVQRFRMASNPEEAQDAGKVLCTFYFT
jgi:hypothetical protein